MRSRLVAACSSALSLVVAASLMGQQVHAFVGRWVSLDETVSLDFEVDEFGREDMGRFLKIVGDGGTLGIWKIVGDSLETTSHDRGGLTGSISYVEEPVTHRYAFSVLDDTLTLTSAGGTWRLVPRLRCDGVRIDELEGPASEVQIRVRPRDASSELAAGLREAASSGLLTTRVADFDSLGGLYGLQAIAAGRSGSFVLHFPGETDVESAARDYCGLPNLLQGVSALRFLPTSVSPSSWGHLKGRHHRTPPGGNE